MKRCIGTLILVVVCAYTQNLLQNPGFESWSSGVPEHWDSDDSIDVTQEYTTVHSGNCSAKESLYTQEQGRADLYQGRFAVHPNTEYVFTVWIYDGDEAGRIRHGIDWFPTGSQWHTNYTGDSTAWQELTLRAQSPSDAESAMAFVRAYDSAAAWDGGAVFYIDDASFSAVAEQPPFLVRAWHMPMNPDSSNAVDAYAAVTDDGVLTRDTLYYGVNDLSLPNAITHTGVSHDTFQYVIPGCTTGDTVFYYLVLTDDDNLVTISDTHAYYVGDCRLAINEVHYDSPGPDSGCYVEIFGDGGRVLDGFSVVGVNGSNGSPYATVELSGHVIPADGFFVIAQDSSVANHDTVTQEINLQNGPDNVELRFHGITVEALGYGTLDGWVFTGEWSPAPDVAHAHCLGRYPDGYDSDHNMVDFHDYTIHTPGEGNSTVESDDGNSRSALVTVVPNPVRPRIPCGLLLARDASYPVVVYNTLGRIVLQASTPHARLALPCGVYFLKATDRVDYLKFVVVD
jgi:hypothetical protein